MISLRDYFVYLIYITGAFLIGGLIEMLLLAKMFRNLDKHDFPYLINTFSLKLVKFHDWGLFVSGITCLLIYFLTKTVKVEN